MIRLLMAGAHVLRTGEILLDVTPHRDRLLSIKRGEVPWSSVTAWAADLQSDLAAAASATSLPSQPDFKTIDQLLLGVREEGLK